MSVRVGSRSSASLVKGTCAARKFLRSTSAGSALTSGGADILCPSRRRVLPRLGDKEFNQKLGRFEMLGRSDDAQAGDVHDCTHPALLLIRHEGGDRRGRLGCEMAIDIVVVDDAERSLSLRDLPRFESFFGRPGHRHCPSAPQGTPWFVRLRGWHGSPTRRPADIRSRRWEWRAFPSISGRQDPARISSSSGLTSVVL